MITHLGPTWKRDQSYPDSDGKPMADNTRQFRWIVTIQGNLEGMYRHEPNVFVASDLLWYPEEGHPEISSAPDAYAVFGRPKGYRGSYKQWEEGGIAPQVVFEVRSPSNSRGELDRKFAFYDRYGVEEYYLYDPDLVDLQGWIREHGRLQPIPQMHGWVSPRLGIRFDLSEPELVIFRPDNRRFLTFNELLDQEEQGRELAHRLREAMKAAQQQTEEERKAREAAQEKAERLAARLRELGIDPDQLLQP